MPPRWFCFLVLVLWVLTTGRLLWNDLLPHLLPGNPPPYTIDLVEETETQRMYIPWTLNKDDQAIMMVRTRVEKVGRDLFELSAEYLPSEKGKTAPISGMNVKRMFSAYQVNSEGELRGIRVEVLGQPDIPWLGNLQFDLDLHIEGKVTSGQMAPIVTGKVLGQEKRIEMPPVDVPRGGGLLQPLHPVNRIRDLRPGQAWTVPVFDSLADSMQSIQGVGSVPRVLRARVRPAPEVLEGGKRKPEECYVIDYTSDEIQATTWVSTRTGLVLAQKVLLNNTRWAMYRD
jgi:hypothetical protein